MENDTNNNTSAISTTASSASSSTSTATVLNDKDKLKEDSINTKEFSFPNATSTLPSLLTVRPPLRLSINFLPLPLSSLLTNEVRTKSFQALQSLLAQCFSQSFTIHHIHSHSASGIHSISEWILNEFRLNHYDVHFNQKLLSNEPYVAMSEVLSYCLRYSNIITQQKHLIIADEHFIKNCINYLYSIDIGANVWINQLKCNKFFNNNIDDDDDDDEILNDQVCIIEPENIFPHSIVCYQLIGSLAHGLWLDPNKLYTVLQEFNNEIPEYNNTSDDISLLKKQLPFPDVLHYSHSNALFISRQTQLITTINKHKFHHIYLIPAVLKLKKSQIDLLKTSDEEKINSRNTSRVNSRRPSLSPRNTQPIIKQIQQQQQEQNNDEYINSSRTRLLELCELISQVQTINRWAGARTIICEESITGHATSRFIREQTKFEYEDTCYLSYKSIMKLFGRVINEPPGQLIFVFAERSIIMDLAVLLLNDGRKTDLTVDKEQIDDLLRQWNWLDIHHYNPDLPATLAEYGTRVVNGKYVSKQAPIIRINTKH